MRSVPEWIGKTDAAKIPPRVRQRIFDRDGGVCHYCKMPFHTGEGWQADHIIALVNGGKHVETNLAPIHKLCHSIKTQADVATKAKIAAVRARHTGVKQPTGTLRSAGFQKAEKQAKPLKHQPLPPKQLFRSAP